MCLLAPEKLECKQSEVWRWKVFSQTSMDREKNILLSPIMHSKITPQQRGKWLTARNGYESNTRQKRIVGFHVFRTRKEARAYARRTPWGVVVKVKVRKPRWKETGMCASVLKRNTEVWGQMLVP